MSIAVLAWGSLNWDARGLAIAEDFRPRGPCIRVEFSRVSRDGRLTLVIDEAFGSRCVAYSAASAFSDLRAAIQNLRPREKMPGTKGVGFVETAVGRHSDRAVEPHPQAVASIKTWAQANSFDAAIWTALTPNFHESKKGAAPFSVDAAVRVLEALDASNLAASLEYIRSAPPDVRTPVRDAVEARWPRG